MRRAWNFNHAECFPAFADKKIKISLVFLSKNVKRDKIKKGNEVAPSSPDAMLDEILACAQLMLCLVAIAHLCNELFAIRRAGELNPVSMKPD